MAASQAGAPRDASDIMRISEDQAASQIDSLLDGDPNYVDEEPEKESEAPVEAQEDTEDVSDEESKEEDQPEEESESKTEEVEIDFDEPMFEVEEGGERVSLNQLKKNNMLQADYTKKTQELATQRAEVQEQLNRGTEQQRQEFLTALDNTKALVMQLAIPEAQNLDQLAEEDPAEYIRVQNKRNKMDEVVRQIDAQRSSEIAKYEEYVRTTVMPKEQELTKQLIPDWSDEVRTEIVNTGKKYGFTDQELGAVVDHRYVHLLHDLSKLTKQSADLTTKKDISSKKVVAKPKVNKPGSRSRESKGGESFKKLQKTGRYQDAAGSIAGMLGDLKD
jgi:hypothetical protein